MEFIKVPNFASPNRSFIIFCSASASGFFFAFPGFSAPSAFPFPFSECDSDSGIAAPFSVSMRDQDALRRGMGAFGPPPIVLITGQRAVSIGIAAGFPRRKHWSSIRLPAISGVGFKKRGIPELKNLIRTATFLLSLGSAAGLARAQSIAASLSGFTSTLRVTSVAGVSAKSFSGVAFHPETRNLYVIDNDNAVVYELNSSGVLLRSIATSGFLDPEGIVYQSDDYFLISEEGLGNIVRVKLPRAGAGPVPKSGGATLNIAQNLANSGIEGVAYRSVDKTAFAVNETAPSRLYRITLDASGVPNASFPGDPFDIGGKTGDAADIYALNDGNFIVVNQEQDKLEGYGPKGQMLSSLSLGMEKPEGIAIDTATGTIYIVGEPMEFSVFKKPGTRTGEGVSDKNGLICTLIPGATTGAAPSIRYSLRKAAGIRIETAALNGTWSLAFSGRVAPGPHTFELPRTAASRTSALSAASAGIRYCRFTTGSTQRVFQYPMISPDR